MKQFIVLFLSSLLLFSCSKDENTEVSVTYSSDELQILELINIHRAGINKSALSMDEIVYQQAMEHSMQMADGSVSFGHDGFSDRVDKIQEVYGNGAAAENVANGYSSPEAVVEGWLNSSGHKANIEGDYTICGVAIAYDNSGTPYYTHIFFNK